MRKGKGTVRRCAKGAMGRWVEWLVAWVLYVLCVHEGHAMRTWASGHGGRQGIQAVQ
jgi:hypothetical protein